GEGPGDGGGGAAASDGPVAAARPQLYRPGGGGTADRRAVGDGDAVRRGARAAAAAERHRALGPRSGAQPAVRRVVRSGGADADRRGGRPSQQQRGDGT